MTKQDFVVSGDGHLLEPVDLFKARLPEHLRDRAVWEEDFELDEPWVEDGARVFRRLHTAGYEGWTISRYRQTGGRSEEHTSELQSLMRISYAVFSLKQKIKPTQQQTATRQ